MSVAPVAGYADFGPSVSGFDVEKACIDLLRTWSSTYLAEEERKYDLTPGALPRFRTYRTAPSFDKWPEDQLPALVLMSVGLAEAPRRDGDGVYMARWECALGVIVSAAKEQQARFLGHTYLEACRRLFIQRPSLDGFGNGLVWLDEDYTQLVFDDQRTLCAPTASFTVGVAGVVQGKAGPVTPDQPLSPDTDPWPPWPLVQRVETVVEQTYPDTAE